MAKIKKAKKKAQFGDYLEKDKSTGNFTRTTKVNTAGGPRYYQSTGPREDLTALKNNARAMANSADSTRAADINPRIIKALEKDKNGGKLKKAKSGKKITPVPNGPLVKKKGVMAGSTLKKGGKLSKKK